MSDYHWRTKENPESAFSDFLELMIDGHKEDPYGVRSPFRSNWEIYTINNVIQANMILRYEDLTKGLKDLGDGIGVPTDIGTIFRKAHFRPKASLKQYYTDETVELVRGLYKEEIRVFGYNVPF